MTGHYREQARERRINPRFKRTEPRRGEGKTATLRTACLTPDGTKYNWKSTIFEFLYYDDSELARLNISAAHRQLHDAQCPSGTHRLAHIVVHLGE